MASFSSPSNSTSTSSTASSSSNASSSSTVSSLSTPFPIRISSSGTHLFVHEYTNPKNKNSSSVAGVRGATAVVNPIRGTHGIMLLGGFKQTTQQSGIAQLQQTEIPNFNLLSHQLENVKVTQEQGEPSTFVVLPGSVIQQDTSLRIHISGGHGLIRSIKYRLQLSSMGNITKKTETKKSIRRDTTTFGNNGGFGITTGSADQQSTMMIGGYCPPKNVALQFKVELASPMVIRFGSKENVPVVLCQQQQDRILEFHKKTFFDGTLFDISSDNNASHLLYIMGRIAKRHSSETSVTAFYEFTLSESVYTGNCGDEDVVREYEMKIHDLPNEMHSASMVEFDSDRNSFIILTKGDNVDGSYVANEELSAYELQYGASDRGNGVAFILDSLTAVCSSSGQTILQPKREKRCRLSAAMKYVPNAQQMVILGGCVGIPGAIDHYISVASFEQERLDAPTSSDIQKQAQAMEANKIQVQRNFQIQRDDYQKKKEAEKELEKLEKKERRAQATALKKAEQAVQKKRISALLRSSEPSWKSKNQQEKKNLLNLRGIEFQKKSKKESFGRFTERI